MKKRYRAPLLLKLIIATTFWGLFYWLLSLIPGGTIYQTVLCVSGICVLIYNLAILMITHKRIHKNTTNKEGTQNTKNNEPWSI
jgi:L-asparagine transporter-like permease